MLNFGFKRSGRSIPRTNLLIYLARPNSDAYLTGETDEIQEDQYDWGYYLPDDSDIRDATGWVTGTANVFYDAAGDPVVALATEIATALSSLPSNVLFRLIDATTQTGKLAIYETGTSATILGKAEKALRIDSPEYLFYGKQGVWFDPSDLTTMFQDAAGTLPMYHPGRGQDDPPVGLVLDKSGNNNHASQSTTTARPVLSGRYNILIGTNTLATQSVTTHATNYTLKFSGTGSIALSGTATGTKTAGSSTITCTAGTLTLTVTGLVTSADLRATGDGVGLPAYQRVIDANTYDTAGFPLYWKFDGTNDFLETSSVDFSGTDEVSICCGIRRNVNGPGCIVELSTSVASINGTFALFSSGSSGVSNVVLGVMGSVTKNTTVVTPTAPLSLVASCRAKLSTDYVDINIPSHTLTGTSSSDSGSGNFIDAVMYIGARAGVSSRVNGRIYQLCIIGSVLSDDQVETLETYINSKMRAY